MERGIISPMDVVSYTKENPVYISPVTIAELTYGAEIAKDEEIKQKRLAALERLKKKPTLIIDDITGSIFGKLSVSLFKQGRDSEFRVQDVLLASQAIQYNYQFLIKNKKDFQDIPGLDLVVFGE